MPTTPTPLCELALKYVTDKAWHDRTEDHSGESAHDYTPYYHELLKDRDVKRVLEVGIGEKKYNAASLRMWAEYFPEAEIYGCDIDASTFVTDNPRIHCFLCDQSDAVSLQEVGRQTGGNFDLIVDDGSHYTEHQKLTFKTLYPLLSSKGVYIIEDVDVPKAGTFGDVIPGRHLILPPHVRGRINDCRIIVESRDSQDMDVEVQVQIKIQAQPKPQPEPQIVINRETRTMVVVASGTTRGWLDSLADTAMHGNLSTIDVLLEQGRYLSDKSMKGFALAGGGVRNIDGHFAQYVRFKRRIL